MVIEIPHDQGPASYWDAVKIIFEIFCWCSAREVDTCDVCEAECDPDGCAVSVYMFLAIACMSFVVVAHHLSVRPERCHSIEIWVIGGPFAPGSIKNIRFPCVGLCPCSYVIFQH